jgi:hypothetical protein
MAREIRDHKAAIGGLILLAIVPYLNSLGDGFAFDDEFQILENPAVTNGVSVLEALTSTVFGTAYRPVTIFTFGVNHATLGGGAAPFHGVNVLLHAAATVLVFWLALRLFGRMRLAWLAGALFAVHPVHTEAVTSIVGRAELLAALFGLGALLSAAHIDRPAGGGRRAAWQVLSLVSFSLALLSKESALTILPLIVLYRVARSGASFGRGLGREMRSGNWVPYACCAAVYLALRTYVTGGLQPSDTVTPLNNMLAFVPWMVRVRSAVGVLWDYFGLLNLPLVLAADYSHAQVPVVLAWTDPRFLAGAALIVVAAVVFLRQRVPTLCFAVVLPLVALSLTANLFFPIGTAKAERLLYLPSVGWVLVLAYLFDRALAVERHRRTATLALVVLTLAFAVRTWERNWDWADNPSLYRSMARSAPLSAKSHYFLAITLQRQGDDGRAVAQFRRALDVYPWLENAAVGVGLAFDARGHVDAAAQWYERALEVAPAHEPAHVALCSLLTRTRRFAAAAVACRRGLRYSPANPQLLEGLGASLAETGAREQGIVLLQRALDLDADDAALRAYLVRLTGAAKGVPARAMIQ